MHYLARCSLSELNTLWEWGDLSISESNLRPPLIWYVESHESDQSTRKTEGSLTPRALANGAFPLHGTARYGSLLGGFPLGTVPGTWYFFSTTSVEVPCKPYRYQNVTCKLCWSLIGLRKSSLLRHWTCDTRPSSKVLPARFKSAQPAKDRTQLLFKQTHIFASTTK